jgi:hypothetical protein
MGVVTIHTNRLQGYEPPIPSRNKRGGKEFFKLQQHLDEKKPKGEFNEELDAFPKKKN